MTQERIYEVYMAFADHFDTNWLVRAPNQKEAARRVRVAAQEDSSVLRELARYGYDVLRPSVVSARRTDDEFWEDFPELKEREVTSTPLLYDSGT